MRRCLAILSSLVLASCGSGPAPAPEPPPVEAEAVPAAPAPAEPAAEPEVPAAAPEAPAAEPSAPPETPMPEPAETPAGDIQGEEIEYAAGGVTMKGYVAWDAAREGTRPGVLVVHEWWGHNDYARNRARMLAAMGYIALAVDMFGDGKTADHPKDARAFADEVFADLAAARARFDAAHAALMARDETDGERIAAIGYCFGGGIVLHMARAGADLAGVASFHGSLGTQTPAQAGVVSAKVLVCHGADDKFIPAEVVEKFKQEMADAGVDCTFVAYPGALHGFTNPDATAIGERFQIPIAHQPEADAESWAELGRFLARVFAE